MERGDETKMDKLEREFRDYKEENNKVIHAIQLESNTMKGKVSGLEESMKEILENSRWMKRAWTRGVISLVVSVSGSIILALGAVVWFILAN